MIDANRDTLLVTRSYRGTENKRWLKGITQTHWSEQGGARREDVLVIFQNIESGRCWPWRV